MNRAWRELWVYMPILAVSVGVAYVYHWRTPVVYEAQARVRVPHTIGSTRDQLWPPAVYAAAAALLDKQQVDFPERHNADLPTVLGEHFLLEVEPGAVTDEVLLRYSSTDPEATVMVLGVLLDAWLPQLPAAHIPQIPPAVQQERAQLDQALNQQHATISSLKTGQSVTPDLPARLASVTVQVKAAIAERDAVDELRDASKQQLASETPESVVGQWPDGALKQQASACLTALSLDQEIQKLESSRQKMAGVYGRKHPKMTELVKRLETARTRRAAFPAKTESHGQTGGESVILALNDEWNRRQAAVEPLEAERQKLEATRQQAAEQQSKIDEASREFTRLEGQAAVLDARMAKPKIAPGMQTEVLQPAAQMPDPISPPLSQTLANGVIAGLLIGLVLQAWTLKRRPRVQSQPSSNVFALPTPRQALA